MLEGDIAIVFPVVATFLGRGRVVQSVKRGQLVCYDPKVEFVLHVGKDGARVIKRGGADVLVIHRLRTVGLVSSITLAVVIRSESLFVWSSSL